MARKPIAGYEHRYSTDGVSVFRNGVKQKLRKDGYYLVPNGSTSFDVVSEEYALSGGEVPAKKAKTKRKKK